MSIFGSKVQGAEIAVDVTADTKPAERELGLFGGKLGKTASGFGTILATGAAVMGTAVAGGLVKAVIAGANLAETMSKTNVVFGDASGVVVAEADRMASAFGLPKQAILDAASSFGLLFKGAGMASTASAGLSNEMAGLAADASSFYNVPLEEALAAIKSGLVGESEPLRAYGVLLNEAAVQEEAVAMGIAKAGAKLTEQQKVMARSSLISKGLGDATGDLERTQDSVSNRWRQFTGILQNTAAEVGMSLQPAISTLLGSLVGGASVIQGFASNFGYAFGAVIDMLVNGTTDADDWINGLGLTPDSPAILGIEMIRQAIAYVFQDALPAAFGVAKEAIGFLWASLSSPAVLQLRDAVLNLVEAFGGWGNVIKIVGAVLLLIIAPIPTIIAALVALYVKFEGFREVVNTLVGFVVGTLLPALVNLAAWLVGAFVAAWNTAVSVVQAVMPALQVLVAVFQTVFAVIIGVVQVAWAVISAAFSAALAVLGALWKAGWALLGPVLTGAWEIFKTIISTALKIITGIIVAVMAIMKGDWGRAWDAMKAVGKAAWDGLIAIVKTLINTLLGVVKGLVVSIPGALAGLAGKLRDIGVGMMNGLIGGVKDMAGRVADAAVGVVMDAWRKAKSAIGMSSPSKLWATMGVAQGEGLIQGNVRIKPKVQGSAQDLVDAAKLNLGESALSLSAVGQGAGGSSSAQFTFHTYNPIAEPNSVTTNRALARVGALGLLG